MFSVCTLGLLLFLAADGPQFDRDGLASYNTAVKSYRQGAFAQAASSYVTCYGLALTPMAAAMCSTGAGISLTRQGLQQDATVWLRRALEIWPTIPHSGTQRARASLWLAEAQRALARFGEAESTLRSAIAALPAGGEHAELSSRLALILKDTDRPDEALGELRAVLANPGIAAEQRGQALIAKAELDRHALRYRDCLEELNAVLKSAVEQGSTRLESEALQGLGLVYMSMGDLARAEPNLKRSLSLEQAEDSPDPQRLGTALQCLAALHARSGRYSMAEEELGQSLANLHKKLHEGHPQIAAVMGDLADVYRMQNRLAEARECAGRAYSVIAASLGPDTVTAAEMLGLRARIEAQSNDPAHAAEDYAAAIAALRRRGAEHDIRMALLMEGYAGVLAGMNRSQEAKQVRTELNAFFRR